MRALFCSTSGLGDLHPIIALALAAKAEGHEVAIATDRERGAIVDRLGLKFFPTGDNPRALMLERYPDVPLPPRDPEGSKLVARLMFGGIFVEVMLPAILEACESWSPDLIVRGHLCLAPWLAAEKLDLPHVTAEAAASGFTADRAAYFVEPMTRWLDELGLPPDPKLDRIYRYLWLAPFPASLRHPDAPFGPTARRTQPLIFNGSVTAASPAWLNDLPGDRPIVHASLGTVLQRPEKLRVIVDAFADEHVTLVLATGNPALQETLGELPSNVIAEPFVSHTHLLPRCDALITHAGAGTLITGIMHGLPMVLVPFFGDQPPNAAMAAAAGCGTVLDHETLTPDDLRQATRTILADSRYRESSERVRQETLALPDHKQAVGWLEHVARHRTPPTEA
jgi:UDP:flavonoid glycosyltransferase YjiC (YdhE family)